MSNFKFFENVDVAPLLKDLALWPHLWNEDRVRTLAPDADAGEVDDIRVRYQCGKSRINQDLECYWYPSRHYLPSIERLVFCLSFNIGAVRIGRVIITRLASGKSIPLHEDGGAVARYYTRVLIVLQSEPGCVLQCGDESIEPKSGDVWWFDHRKRHGEENLSAKDRLMMIVDVKR
jgi:hypothetical protein